MSFNFTCMYVLKEREKKEERGERNSERKGKKWKGGQIREKKTEDEGENREWAEVEIWFQKNETKKSDTN